MTPQEKAKELISTNSLTILSVVGNKLTMDEAKDIAKQCSIISLDEIINQSNYGDEFYWEEVRKELEKP